MGIEPTSEAWEACNITQKHAGLAAFLQLSESLNWKIMGNGIARKAAPHSAIEKTFIKRSEE
jgi:hypothetical protein